MSELYIYIMVILITVFICSCYGVYYVSKVIKNQRNIENELTKIVKEYIRQE